MPKPGEIDYLHNIGEDGRRHTLNKPFSDLNCGLYLHDLGTIMSLLPPLPARLLDLGAGSGWTSCFFALRGYEVVAQDIADDMIELLEQNKKKYRIEHLQTIINDYEQLDFDEEFDCAIFYDSLHHAEDEYQALRSAYNALKPGGILVTAEPGVGHSTSPASRQAMAQFGVTEKDMPPRKIIDIAGAIGFSQHRIYFRQTQPIPLFPRFSKRSIKALIRTIAAQLRGNHIYRGHFVVLTK